MIFSALVGAASNAPTTVISPVKSNGLLNAIDARMKPAFANAEVVLQTISNKFKLLLSLQFKKKLTRHSFIRNICFIQNRTLIKEWPRLFV